MPLFTFYGIVAVQIHRRGSVEHVFSRAIISEKAGRRTRPQQVKSDWLRGG